MGGLEGAPAFRARSRQVASRALVMAYDYLGPAFADFGNHGGARGSGVGVVMKEGAGDVRTVGDDGELVAVVAAQVPRAGAVLGDGPEGAEPALGRSAATRQVDRQRLGLLAGERGAASGQEFTRLDGAGARDPDLLEHIFQIRSGPVHVRTADRRTDRRNAQISEVRKYSACQLKW
ncbi:hypothetical protein ACFUNF_21145 [Streptomyces sp. NPDC057291]|uniref:hypothetical protein n=1 Tax=Streptomyces sp. NPDC057291 TaxID=3346087 RepID=UPI003628CBBC